MKKALILILAILMLFSVSACTKTSEESEYLDINTKLIPDGSYPTEIENINISSSNETSVKFLSALNDSGFDFDMNHKKLQKVAEKIKLSNGKNMYENGYVYKLKDLYGFGYGFGETNDCASYKSELKDSKLTETYDLFVYHELEGTNLPGDLKIGSSFETALKEFSILDKYEEAKDGYEKSIKCYDSNGESLVIYFTTWHGKVDNTSLQNASATIAFTKNDNKNTVKCLLNFNDGKLFTYQYISSTVTPDQKQSGENNTIAIVFFQQPFKNDSIEGSFDSLFFTQNSVKLTITAKSKTGKTENYKIPLDGWVSADLLESYGDFNFEITPDEKQLTVEQSQSNINYFDKWILFDYLTREITLSNIQLFEGEIYINRSMSR